MIVIQAIYFHPLNKEVLMIACYMPVKLEQPNYSALSTPTRFFYPREYQLRNKLLPLSLKILLALYSIRPSLHGLSINITPSLVSLFLPLLFVHAKRNVHPFWLSVGAGSLIRLVKCFDNMQGQVFKSHLKLIAKIIKITIIIIIILTMTKEYFYEE